MGISLPTMAIGVSGLARVLFVGRYQVLAACRAANTSQLLFLESICQFCAGECRAAYRVLLLAWPPVHVATLVACLTAMEMVAEASDTIIDLKKFNLVITTTDITDVTALETFLESDKGLILCGHGDDDVALPIRKLLEKFGIGIPPCQR
jgi:hypothetical protein